MNLKINFVVFFCGERNCKHENYINNIKNDNAIKGLN